MAPVPTVDPPPLSQYCDAMPRRPAVPATERRNQVLAVARVHFAERGYERTSMLALAEELDVDRVVLYRLFPNLAAIYEPVLAQVEAQLTAVLDDADRAALEEPAPPRRPERMLAVLVKAARADPAAWRLLTQAPLDPEVAAVHRALRERMREAVAGAIVQRARVLRPEVTPARVATAAEFLVAGVEAALAHQIANRPSRDDAAFARVLGAAVVRFLGDPEPAPAGDEPPRDSPVTQDPRGKREVHTR